MIQIARAILWGGILCGTLDAAAATSSFRLQGIPPLRVWQGVASGLLGAGTFQKGWKTSLFGLLLHFLIAFTAASAFCLVARRIPILLGSPVIVGPSYGILVFLVMNLIVVPLSARPKRPVTGTGIASQLLIHILCVGLPISFSASHVLS